MVGGLLFASYCMRRLKGYLSIFLAGIALAPLIRSHYKSLHEIRIRLLQLCVLALALLLLAYAVDQHIQTVSRRMANLAYVLFVLALSLLVMCVLFAAQLWVGGGTGSSLMLYEAVNRNQLFVFLLVRSFCVFCPCVDSLLVYVFLSNTGQSIDRSSQYVDEHDAPQRRRRTADSGAVYGHSVYGGCHTAQPAHHAQVLVMSQCDQCLIYSCSLN